MGEAYLFLSGKGGTGKTTLATSLALALARAGNRTVLVDADVGLRCADLLLGMENEILYDLSDVAENRCTLNQALARHPGCRSLGVLSAPQTLFPSQVRKRSLEDMIAELRENNDFVLIDCPAGLGRGLKNVWGAAQEAVMVTTPDDAAIRAAERLSQLLFEKRSIHPRLLLNRADRTLIAVHEERRPSVIAQQTDMELLGVIPDSPDVYRALLMHKTALESDSPRVRRALQRTADRLSGTPRRLPRYCR